MPRVEAAQEGVMAWEGQLVLPSYMPEAPDRNPMFLERRVYQGSSGGVYPLPVIDRIEVDAAEHGWRAIYLENEFLHLAVLPEIGGRIHVGRDKRNGYDFFYRQDVIKPALVGLAGPWISGGVEFNWPQHHRPATFMPVEVEIEREADGAVTVWCSDHDPIARMKGMHGLRLRPGVAVLEVRVRLFNRTEETQTFLWWANVATEVHEAYQSFFPSDVRVAADHAKRATTAYPLCEGEYYGVDYAGRARTGVPERERPERFSPGGEYAANDLGWYANIPVPTSYMIVGSRGDFFGGYDHKRRAGTVAFADHHVAPGKKQWTWGNHNFGYAWDRHLTDDDRPYVELMSGAYTENQPDFSFLAPGETKSFSQYWYPIGDIGVPSVANLDAALRVGREDGGLELHVQVMRVLQGCTLVTTLNGREFDRWTGDLSPDAVLHHRVAGWPKEGEFAVELHCGGEVLLRHAPTEVEAAPAPEAATEPVSPAVMETNEELFLTGMHLEQYRHPTRLPELYWEEALRRDPGDSRSNLAMGRWHLRRGEFTQAESLLRRAIGRLTRRNPNPYDGEPFFQLGRVLRFQGRSTEAYEAFYKSTWNASWRGPGYQRLAELDCAARRWERAVHHLRRSLAADAENLSARNLLVIALRRLGQEGEAAGLLQSTRALDPLDVVARWLATTELPRDGQQRLDLAFDLLRAGLLEEARGVVSAPLVSAAPDGARTMLLYVHASTLQQMGEVEKRAELSREAASADASYVFPSRLEEMLVLQEAMEANPADARAPYYLGNFLYHRRRHREAIGMWEQATVLDASFATAWRNLGFGYFNVRGDEVRARDAFARARAASPRDARLLLEQDQLLKRVGEPLRERLQALEQSPDLVLRRDDLSVEMASLLNSTGAPVRARAALLERRFQPWEGGEGRVLGELERSSVLLAHALLQRDEAAAAIRLLEEALNPPTSLGEQRHLLANVSLLQFWMGRAWEAAGAPERAREHWERAAEATGDFQRMAVQAVSEVTFWSVRALQELGRAGDAAKLLETMSAYAAQLRAQRPEIDYFATSLPTMLLFPEDLEQQQEVLARFLEAQVKLGGGEGETAIEELRAILQLDPSHAPSLDLLQLVEAS